MPSKSIHIAAGGSISSFYGGMLFRCVCPAHHLCGFICWWTLRCLLYLGCCKQRSRGHCSARIFLNCCFLFSLDVCRRVRLLDRMVLLFIVCWGSTILFSTVDTPVHILTNSVWEAPCLHPRLFSCWQSSKCEAMTLCVPFCGRCACRCVCLPRHAFVPNVVCGMECVPWAGHPENWEALRSGPFWRLQFAPQGWRVSLA